MRTDRGGEQLLRALGGLETPLDVSSDGRLLVYSDANRETNQDLWLLPLGNNQEPRKYLTTLAWEMAARFSPDSQWLAFVSNESGAAEVYVAPVDDAGARYRVSSAGGIAPRWGRDGKELIYVTPDGNLVSVPLMLGRQVQRGAPTMMFRQGSLYEGYLRGNIAYELTPDGQRLLVNRVLRDPAVAPLTLLIELDQPASQVKAVMWRALCAGIAALGLGSRYWRRPLARRSPEPSWTRPARECRA